MSNPPQLALLSDTHQTPRDLERLRSLLPAELVSTLVALLSECADPVQALNLFERLIVANQNLVGVLLQERVLLQRLLALFGQSYWLSGMIIKNPEIVDSLARESHLERPREPDEFRTGLEHFLANSTQADLSTLLAGFKKREYIRIALRDILGISTLAETTAELSALADVILESALQHAQLQMQERPGGILRRAVHDQASQCSILSLGKLGGNELNYSSDVDLLYLYGDKEPYDAAAGREFFTSLFQFVTDLLGRTTSEGPVFRIDLRLRPLGREGEIAIGLQQALEYYRQTARDWELQALIKVRHSAGDQSLSSEFIRGVQARVYSGKGNFAAIDTALRSRDRIRSRRGPRGFQSFQSGAIDVKLDRGGIRDIEFLVQCLQRTYGGEENWLRSGGTLFSLQKLHDKGHISGRDFHELTQAYEFLRALEHRLQLQHGQQTHRLPPEPEVRSVVCRAMAFRSNTQNSADLDVTLLEHMRRVARIYDRIVLSQRSRQKRAASSGGEFPSPSAPHEMSFEQLLEQLAQDSAELDQIAARSYSIHTRRNLQRFLSSAMTSSERYAALLENPNSVEKAIPLLASSDYLTEILVRHPDVIRVLDAISAAEGETRLPEPAEELLSHDDLSGSSRPLDALRRSFRKLSFGIGAQDLLVPRPALQSMRESSALADAAIFQALQIIGAEDTLAVFALGRLGTQEFDVASDADLLFIRSFETDEDVARAAAEKLIHALAAYTREGLIFAVDARLRPHGNEGELVVTPLQLERYMAEEARPWEALTYTKLRFIAGREDLAALILPRVSQIIVEMAAPRDFARAVAEMRARLEKSNRYPHSFKLAPGGFYDIDFIASFRMLHEGSLHPGNTLERLDHLYRNGFLDESSFQQLRDGTVLYRTADHVIRLVTGHARPELPAAEHARVATETLIEEILNGSSTSSIQQMLDAKAEEVRTIFENTFAANGNGL